MIKGTNDGDGEIRILHSQLIIERAQTSVPSFSLQIFNMLKFAVCAKTATFAHRKHCSGLPLAVTTDDIDFRLRTIDYLDVDMAGGKSGQYRASHF